ncbi:MAG: TonB-dependent receptor domain-containing protein [Gammaproteobacteria bacterium]|jgi:vitamin B12 transporter|tara:strand:+ start:40 stop:1788 length:1749 start_codon:yes stop_codon:yes gene_type:complete
MFTRNLIFAAFMSAILFSNSANAIIGPIKISLNTEYRTSSPVVGSIATTIKLDKAAIKRTGASTFTGLLQSIPSVSFEGGQGNLQALRIRGNEASHTLLLLDGHRVTVDGGQANLDVIPIDQIERIEISKGPFSSLYGPGAIGGVIHVFTDKDANSISSNKIDISYGSKGTKKINLNTYLKGDKSYLGIALTDFNTDGIDATGDGDLDPIDRKTTGLNFGTELTESTDISINILNTKANIQYDDSWGTPKPDNNLNQLNISINQAINDKYKINFDLMRQNTQRREDKYKLNTLTVINELDFDNSKLSLGISNEVSKKVGSSNTIKHTDIFSQWQGLIIDNEISIGARVVDHDKFGTHSTYNFNWARDLSSTLRLNGSYGSATNLPDHYKNNANIVAGKTTLKPESSKNLEIGLSGYYGWGNAEFKIYKSKVFDAFKWFNASPAYYKNDGIININGAELSIGTEFLGWDLDTSFDLNKAIAASTNLEKGRRPNRSITLNLSKTSGKWNRSINWIAKSRAWDKDDHSTGENGGYGLLNLSTSYNFTEDLIVYLNRRNTLDKDYEMAKGYNTLGKTTTLGLTYNF